MEGGTHCSLTSSRASLEIAGARWARLTEPECTRDDQTMTHEVGLPRGRVVITEDPLRSLPVGASLSLRPVVIGSSDATVVPDSVRNWDYFDGAVLAVGVGAGTRLDVQGTAVMVAPGLAVTAAHVLRHFLADLMSGTQGCLCIGVRAEGTFDAWKLRSLTLDGGDLAWMSLELCSAIHDDWFFSTVAITSRAPTIGEDLAIVGFHLEPQDTGSEASNAPIEVAGQLLAAAGKVQATYPEGRDAIMVPFPAIEIACGSRGGMAAERCSTNTVCLSVSYQAAMTPSRAMDQAMRHGSSRPST